MRHIWHPLDSADMSDCPSLAIAVNSSQSQLQLGDPASQDCKYREAPTTPLAWSGLVRCKIAPTRPGMSQAFAAVAASTQANSTVFEASFMLCLPVAWQVAKRKQRGPA